MDSLAWGGGGGHSLLEEGVCDGPGARCRSFTFRRSPGHGEGWVRSIFFAGETLQEERLRALLSRGSPVRLRWPSASLERKARLQKCRGPGSTGSGLESNSYRASEVLRGPCSRLGLTAPVEVQVSGLPTSCGQGVGCISRCGPEGDGKGKAPWIGKLMLL